MARFILRRTLFALVLIVVASSGALLLTRLAPGDLTAELGPFADPREVAAARARFGLDRDPLTHLAQWGTRAVRLDFGQSSRYAAPVAPLVGEAALNTLTLGASALLAGTLLGIGLGIVTGSRSGATTALIRAVSLFLLSMPPLLISLLLAFAAARTGLLPTGGMSSIGAGEMSWTAWTSDLLLHLPIPVLALALPLAATLEQLQAQAVRDALHQPFVVAAAARGASRRAIVLRHAWRASLPPICGIYGIAIGALLSGSFAVEYVTAWPGLGRLMYDALIAHDIYLVAGCAAAGASLLAFGTLLGDLLLAAADPRVAEPGR